MKKNIHDEAKEKDILQVSGINTMGWVEKHIPTVLMVLGVAFVIGLGLVVINHFRSKAEVTAMETYFKVEKDYLKKKDGFKMAAEKAAHPETEKENTKKTDDKKFDVELVATGDIEKDYGSIITDFKNVVTQYNGSTAAALSALHLAEIYNQYKKAEDGFSVIEGQKNKINENSLVGGLLMQTYGTLLANQGKCADANKVWGTLLGKSKLSFMESELKIKMALCHESLGDLEKARAILQEVSAKGGEGKDGSRFTTQAKQYLRLLNMDLAKKGT
jgi:ATP/maltotriose-dependent transcriptional regulator MalT